MHKVLIIEDDNAFSHICKTKLEEEGYRVAVAHDGQTGLQKFHDFQPNLVLLDLSLPKISGLDVLNHVRSNHNTQSCGVIAFSSSRELLEQAKTAGANKTLEKESVTPTHIAAQVTEVLSRMPLNESSKQFELLPIAVDPRPKGKVLVVEDDAATALLVTKIIEDEGYAVKTAKDGLGGYKMLINDKDFVLAIFDINMPKLSGMDLLRLLRKDTRLAETPVLLMSADKPTQISFESYDTGIIVFVPKPFTKVTLKAMINLCLSQ